MLVFQIDWVSCHFVHITYFLNFSLSDDRLRFWKNLQVFFFKEGIPKNGRIYVDVNFIPYWSCGNTTPRREYLEIEMIVSDETDRQTDR